MPCVRANGKLLFFAHVPKTGGSSVEDYLAARFGPLSMLDRGWFGYRYGGGGARSAGLLTSPQHLTAADAGRLFQTPPDWSFAVVRDPVARIVSEYRYMAARGRRPWRWLAKAGFSPWLHTVLRAARHDPTIFDNHLRPQSDIVPAEAEVFRLEDGLDALIARIDAVTGTTAPGLAMGHALKSGPADRPDPAPADLAAIGQAYASDYARFGYPPPASRRRGMRGVLRRIPAAVAGPILAHLWRSGRL